MGVDSGRVARTRYGTPAPVRTPAPARDAAQSAITVPSSGGDVALEPGARVHQYELIRELGRGGMGVVFAARDTRLGRRVAIKFVPEASRDLAERFLIEAQATAQCTHDNIVIIHEVDDFHGIPYMVLEFLEGKTLRDLIDSARVPPMRTVELAVPILRALSRAHELGVVHRDLKPENVFVTTGGQVKVLDFGIAKALRDGSVARDTRPEAGLVGTLAYMSPEQMGTDEVDERSDVWSAGIIMFEMLSGHHPIEPATFENLVANATSPQPMRTLREVAPDVPEELARLVDACLVKRKADRPTSQAFLRALELLVPNRAGRVLAEGESPYPGLTSFQESDADRFFGRDREVARTVARVRELPLIGVVGPSGAGKSSFVRAGVGPALKASGERWEIFTVRPGRNPLASLASVMLRLTARGGEPEDVVARLKREPGYLGELLRTRARETNSHYVLFVDQLEELYTLVTDADVRRAFTAALAAIADDVAAPLRVVVSMRSDFLDRVGEDATFADDLSRGLVFLATPDAAGLREALVQPIELVGYRFETDAMIDDMLESLAGTPGALPLLQFAASLLWDARDRDRRLVTASSYAAIGGISGALATHADDVVARMNASAQKLTQQIFRALVTPERTRAIVELADLLALGGDVQRVIDQLVAARLLVVQTRGGGGSVELVHESLIERWPMLRRWLDEDQEDSAFLAQVSAAAKQWDAKQRPAGLLWRGDALDDARHYLAHRRRALPGREHAFVAAAFALARRGHRRRLALVLAGFMLLAAGLAGAIASRASIQRARDAADQAAERAQHSLDEVRAKERERVAAEAERRAAEAKQAAAESTAQEKSQEAQAANTQVEASREELLEQNKKLATTAREAQRATEAAQHSASDAQKAQAALQQALDRERARVKALEDEKKKLSTQLKE
ncbi:MAG TPA: serine/threonine-protein kinase [Kofleriaceae bacterium]|nr:serine/threonine-protein kinase [Kofleriaceae bacterium]